MDLARRKTVFQSKIIESFQLAYSFKKLLTKALIRLHGSTDSVTS